MEMFGYVLVNPICNWIWEVFLTQVKKLSTWKIILALECIKSKWCRVNFHKVPFIYYVEMALDEWMGSEKAYFKDKSPEVLWNHFAIQLFWSNLNFCANTAGSKTWSRKKYQLNKNKKYWQSPAMFCIFKFKLAVSYVDFLKRS